MVTTITEEKDLHPAFPVKNNLVVLSADNNYALYLGVCITSIIENTTQQLNYDIVILETDIHRIYKQMIVNLAQRHENISIRFFNLIKFEEELSLLNQRIHAYFTAATYYRIYSSDIFCNYERMLYLDCDLVVLKDFTFLLTEPFDGKLVITVPDITAQGIAFASDEDCYNNNSYPCNVYFEKTLEIENYQSYFQAGVIVFNLNGLRAFNFKEKAIEKLKKLEKPRWVDQCIMNSVLYGHIKHVELKWNFPYHLNFPENKWQLDSYGKKVPEQLKQIETCNTSLPSVLHVTSSKKPWTHPDTELAHLWWYYARMTPFYEEILYKNMKPKPKQNSGKPNEPSRTDINTKNYSKSILSLQWGYRYNGLLSKLVLNKSREKYLRKKKDYKDLLQKAMINRKNKRM